MNMVRRIENVPEDEDFALEKNRIIQRTVVVIFKDVKNSQIILNKLE